MLPHKANVGSGRRVSRLIAPAFLLACTLVLPGCVHYGLGGADRRDYLVCEQGATRRLHVANVGAVAEILGIPGPAPMIIALVEELPKKHETAKLRRIMADTPPWRRLEGHGDSLCATVHALSAGAPPGRVRWIIGNTPLVVGIGAEDVPGCSDEWPGARLRNGGPVNLGAGQKLIESGDLARKVSRILVLDTWPGSIPSRTPIPASRVIDLLDPLTLEEVLARKPWTVSSPGDVMR